MPMNFDNYAAIMAKGKRKCKKPTVVRQSKFRKVAHKDNMAIQGYHTLHKKLSQISKRLEDSKAANTADDVQAAKADMVKLQQEMDAMGGLEAYQDQSIFGHQNSRKGKCNSAKWVIKQLKLVLPSRAQRIKRHLNHPNCNQSDNTDTRWRLLDVGALTNHYLPYESWISCIPIDLNPRHVSVHKMDFYDIPVAQVDTESFPPLPCPGVLQDKPSVETTAHIDVAEKEEDDDEAVVDEAEEKDEEVESRSDKCKRGEMLSRSYDLLRPGGWCLLILPKNCLLNSRYLDPPQFKQLLELLNFRVHSVDFTAKLAQYVCQKPPNNSTESMKRPRSGARSSQVEEREHSNLTQSRRVGRRLRLRYAHQASSRLRLADRPIELVADRDAEALIAE
eukprot:g57503.t1